MGIDGALALNRAAVDEMILAAERAESNWTTPRASGKWSPSQVTEHVARSLDEGANVVAGRPSHFPTLPFFIRPVARLFFKRILKKQSFPRTKTPAPFDPDQGPESPAAARERLAAALAGFEQECRARAASGPDMSSGVFGTVLLEDYARFQALHTEHHRKQISTAQQ